MSSPLVGLPGRQVVCETAGECAARLAEAVVAQLRPRLAAFARVHLALSGAASGKRVAAALAGSDLGAEEWARIHGWMVDERGVDADDSRLNFASLRDALLGPAAIPAENLHPMPVLVPGGAERYERELRAALDDRPAAERRLDALVLGMGSDGHTASLFPGSAALDERERWVVLNDGETVTPPRPRMTLTFPFINQACFIALLVTGEGKREALRRLAEGREDYRTLPVAGVVGSAETRPIWFLDRAALP